MVWGQPLKPRSPWLTTPSLSHPLPVLDFRWQPAHGGRHVISQDLLPGDEGHTFCGLDLQVPRQRNTKTEWLWPTCQQCYDTAKTRT